MKREEALQWCVDNLKSWPNNLSTSAPLPKTAKGWKWRKEVDLPYLYREGDFAITRHDWVVAKNSAGVNHDLKSLVNATHSQLKTRTDSSFSAINATLDATPEASKLIYLSSRALEAMNCGDVEVAKHCIEMVISDEA